jgi:hypothetical protein
MRRPFPTPAISPAFLAIFVDGFDECLTFRDAGPGKRLN